LKKSIIVGFEWKNTAERSVLIFSSPSADDEIFSQANRTLGN
jgi:hypothetical protein